MLLSSSFTLLHSLCDASPISHPTVQGERTDVLPFPRSAVPPFPNSLFPIPNSLFSWVDSY